MTRTERPKDRLAAAEAAAIASSRRFSVCRYAGPGRYDKRFYDAAEFGGDREAALAWARADATTNPRDEFGRGALVYAVTPTGETHFVGMREEGRRCH